MGVTYCPVSQKECAGVPEGERTWVCPVHGAKLTKHWTKLCRTKEEFRVSWLEGIGPGQQAGRQRMPGNPPEGSSKKTLLGDRVSIALGKVGVTEERVTNWLGRPCGCGERRRKLNLLHAWTEKQLRGLFPGQEVAVAELEELIEINQK